MNFLQRYINYLKDNPEGYWFKRKIWGWGWTPATWQGWLVTIVVIVFVLWRAFAFDSAIGDSEPTSGQLFWFLAEVIAAILVLILVAWRKGEPLKWMWGIPKEKDEMVE